MAGWQELDSSAQFNVYRWVLTAADPIAEPSPPLSIWNDRSVHFYGTLDADGWHTATIAIKGSVAGVLGLKSQVRPLALPYETLSDQIGIALTVTGVNAVVFVAQHVYQIVPTIIAGAVGGNGVIVDLICRGGR